MDDAADDNSRLDDLEAHIAHQDGAIQDLSDMVLKQWDAINALRTDVKGLEDQLHALEDEVATGPGAAPGEEPPPHY
ncbi:MAG: SlyX family protein [Rhodospirillaceae bacterium]|jgi:SlyX protein|nr:SlyX family protein [Rhodospirillaceae bacterium]